MTDRFVRAIFPGSFDPITNGHLDVIKRGIKLFDELIVAVGQSPIKNPLFTPQERVEMIAELIKDIPRVSVESFNCLTVEYAAQKKADVILRGLRNLTDVQYEFQLAMTNRAVAGIDTDGPGYKTIIIHPQPGNMTNAKASYDSINGNIISDWQLKDGTFMLNVTVPANTTATVYIPADSAKNITESGKQAVKAEGVRFQQIKQGTAVFIIGSGQYQFVSKVP